MLLVLIFLLLLLIRLTSIFVVFITMVSINSFVNLHHTRRVQPINWLLKMKLPCISYGLIQLIYSLLLLDRICLFHTGNVHLLYITIYWSFIILSYIIFVCIIVVTWWHADIVIIVIAVTIDAYFSTIVVLIFICWTEIG